MATVVIQMSIQTGIRVNRISVAVAMLPVHKWIPVLDYGLTLTVVKLQLLPVKVKVTIKLFKLAKFLLHQIFFIYHEERKNQKI